MTASTPFWGQWGRERILGWLGGISSLALITLFISWSAQRAAVTAARPETAELFTYSLGGHVIAITLLGCAAVIVASTLLQRGDRVIAALVLGAIAAGPMTVVAAPIRASLIARTSMDSVWYWHLAVGAGLFVVLAAWSLRVVPVAPHRLQALPRTLSDVTVFLVLATVGFAVCWNFTWHLQESPGVLPALGWAVFAAGATVVSLRAEWRASLLLLLLTTLALGVMAWAYMRSGGWPTVAGWEFNGMESPVILSDRVAIVALAAPVLGAVVRSAALTGRRNESRKQSRGSARATA